MKTIIRTILTLAIVLALSIPCMAAEDAVIGPAVALINGIEVYADESGSCIVDNGNVCPAQIIGDTIMYIDTDHNTVYVGSDGEKKLLAPAVTLMNGILIYAGGDGFQWTYDTNGIPCPVTILENGKVAYLDSNHNIVFCLENGDRCMLGAIIKVQGGIEFYEDWNGNWYTDVCGVRCTATEYENGDMTYVGADGQMTVVPMIQENAIYQEVLA